MATRRKKTAVIVAVSLLSGVALTGVAWAVTATLNVGPFVAGEATPSNCDTTWDVVAAAPTYNSLAGAYVFDEVSVTNLDPNCNGSTVSVTVLNTGVVLADGTATISSGSATVQLNQPADVASVTGIASAVY